eukprot:5327643-Prymnesium_polylepis.2
MWTRRCGVPRSSANGPDARRCRALGRGRWGHPISVRLALEGLRCVGAMTSGLLTLACYSRIETLQVTSGKPVRGHGGGRSASSLPGPA